MSVKRESRVGSLSLQLKALESRSVEVGFFDTDYYPDGTPVAYVAAVQEFGSDTVPPRPFFRPATVSQSDAISAMVTSAVYNVAAGADVGNSLAIVGEVVAGMVKEQIISVTSPALSPVTIYNRQHRKDKQRTTSVKPLEDTGLMLKTVKSAVVKK